MNLPVRRATTTTSDVGMHDIDNYLHTFTLTLKVVKKSCLKLFLQFYRLLSFFNPLSAKVKVKVTLCQRVPRLPTSPSLIISQFQLLVVLLSDMFSCMIYRTSGT